MSDTIVSPQEQREHSAIEMIAACFRHQHPEAFGGVAIQSEAFYYGRSESQPSPIVTAIREEPMGYPGARALADVVVQA